MVKHDYADYAIKIEKVDSDDYGDKHWQYYSEVKKNGVTVWTDYHHTLPTVDEIIEALPEASGGR